MCKPCIEWDDIVYLSETLLRNCYTSHVLSDNICAIVKKKIIDETASNDAEFHYIMLQEVLG